MRPRGELRRPAGFFARARRGELTHSELAVLIIILVSAALVIFWVARLRSSFEEVAGMTCAAQVREASYRNKVLGRDEALDITACRPTYQVYQRTQYPTDPLQADKQVKEDLAREMQKCWYAWGKGELDLFNSPAEYCAPCTTIEFNGTWTDVYPDKVIYDFGKYIEETRAPGTTRTYGELFTGPMDDDGLAKPAPPPYTVPIGDPIVIQYSHTKVLADGIFPQVLAAKLGYDLSPQDVGLAAGAIAGVAEWLGPGAAVKGALKGRAALAGAKAAEAEGAILYTRSRALQAQSNVLRHESVVQEYWAYSQAGSKAQGARDASALLAKEANYNNLMGSKTLGEAAESYAKGSDLRVRAAQFGVKSKIGGAGTLAVGALTTIKDSSLSGSGVYAIAYWYTRLEEEFAVGSAMYILPLRADNPYVNSCEQLGSTLTSP